MVAIAQKLSTSSHEGFANRLAESWIVFYGTMLPFFQGCFVPLRNAIALQARDAQGRVLKVDPRRLAIVAYRNYVIHPLRTRVEDLVLKRFAQIEFSAGAIGDPVIEELAQMLGVTSSCFPFDDKQKCMLGLVNGLIECQEKSPTYGRGASSNNL